MRLNLNFTLGLMLSVCFTSAFPAYANVLTLDSSGNYVDASYVKVNKAPYAVPASSQNLQEEGKPYLDPNAAVATDVSSMENPAIFYDAVKNEANTLALDEALKLDLTAPASISLPREITTADELTLEAAPTGDLVFASIVKAETVLSELPETKSQIMTKPVILEAMPSLNVAKIETPVKVDLSSGQTLFDKIIRDEVAKYDNVDAAFVKAVIAAESNFSVTAVSPKGAMGLMQIMPETAKRYSVVNPFSPEQNIRAGTAELSRLMEVYRNPSLALAAYNAGEGAVEKHNGVPPFSETQQYIVRVLTKTFQARERLLVKAEPSPTEVSKEDSAKELNPLLRPLVVQTFNY